ncbi:hypothetical protein [Acetobacteroides hydrogenigenes]|uniref:Uncharacterized protein n=1 Tax=Acetobacteroides hydrogenigenes TaxID=979970 RepID=A0A4R2EYX4_9BACT|nr:hypothetical protein [Acetobacteroides hydrogenigenes]TCN72184.1 hypothetical protein CLV25_102147 [Acetobacteroides hydrogenigenes]
MERIAELLNRYFEGETSIEEERELRAFFRTTQILPSQWEDYRTIFGYFDGERAIVSDRGAAALPVRHRVRNIAWLSTVAAAAACAVFALLYEVKEPTIVAPERSVAQAVKVERVEEVNRVAPQPAKVAPVAISKGKKNRKVAPAKVEEAKSRIVKPARKRQTIDALEEVNGVDNSLKKFEVIRDVNRSLSPLSSLAYLEKYCPAEDENNKK